MKRNLLLLVATLVIMCQIFTATLAATSTVSGPVSIAIKKYKSGNYTGCLQDAQSIVKRDPSNAVAYYYMAMSYVQAGKKDAAVGAYQKVLNLRPNSVLYSYAATGKRCLEYPTECHGFDPTAEAEIARLNEAKAIADAAINAQKTAAQAAGKAAAVAEAERALKEASIDSIVNSSYKGGLSAPVRNQVENKRLEQIKKEMNKDTEINNYKLRQFKDFTNQRSQVEADNKLADEDKMPTNDEIVAALKVLKKAGLDQSSGYSQMANPMMMMPQNAESAQLSMMLGSQNQSGNNNNNMMNMIPFMLAQSKNGQAGGGNPYSPQLMQTMMMNSMLPDFNFNTNDDK